MPEGFATFSGYDEYFDCAMVVICILCAGLAAGLTIGLVSIDHNELKLLLINGSDEEKAQAKKVLPLIKDHHWLLVTLFLFNAVANEALPVFLSGLVPEYVAIVLSTFSVLIFGEILPSSIFSGPSQLRLAASMSGVVNVLLIVFYVIARPIALFLDWWLGKHEETQAPFNAKDLYTLLGLSGVKKQSRHNPRESKMYSKDSTSVSKYSTSRVSGTFVNPLLEHFVNVDDFNNDEKDEENASEERGKDDSDDGSKHRAPDMLLDPDDEEYPLHQDSVMIAQGAIIASRKKLQTIIQSAFYTIYSNEEVTLSWLESIGRSGYSRILVCNGESKVLMGYIVVKEIMADLKKHLSYLVPDSPAVTSPSLVSDLLIHQLLYFDKNATVLDALNIMQEGHSRIGVLTENGSVSSKVIGYFSMEDVVEEIIQEEIEDEKDVSASPRLNRANTAARARSLSRTNSVIAIQMLKGDRTKSIDSGLYSA